jgi:hypothetical protein
MKLPSESSIVGPVDRDFNQKLPIKLMTIGHRSPGASKPVRDINHFSMFCTHHPAKAAVWLRCLSIDDKITISTAGDFRVNCPDFLAERWN